MLDSLSGERLVSSGAGGDLGYYGVLRL